MSLRSKAPKAEKEKKEKEKDVKKKEPKKDAAKLKAAHEERLRVTQALGGGQTLCALIQ